MPQATMQIAGASRGRRGTRKDLARPSIIDIPLATVLHRKSPGFMGAAALGLWHSNIHPHASIPVALRSSAWEKVYCHDNGAKVPVDRSIDPTADQVRALRDDGPDGPITMVNLLKFRKDARYETSEESPCSGREAYERYKHAFTQTVGAVSQAHIVYEGPVQQVFIGTPMAPESDWDSVLIVHYPSRKHFLAMMADPTYRQALRHRYAGLERTVLLQCTA